jgi:hypothetical protein
LREALATHLARLAAEADAGAYEAQPFRADESALDGADDWGASRLTVAGDDVASDCFVSFDNLHTLPRSAFCRHVSTQSEPRMARACRALRAAIAC